jgi:hypothetical protein
MTYENEQITFSVIILDENDPNSLHHKVPPLVWDRLKSVPEAYLSLPVKELRKQAQVGVTLEALRASFWVEYNMARETKKKMVIERMLAGICSKEYFYNYVLRNSIMSAWILTPPENYAKALEAILVRSTERLYEMVDLEFAHYDQGGNVKVDTKVMQIILAAHQHIENRVKGSVVHKLEKKSLNINLNKQAEEISEDYFERKIRDLKTRERKALGQITTADDSGGGGEVLSDVGSAENSETSGD